MNKVILTGRLTRDPEISYAQSSGNAIARFTLAVDRRFKREGEPEADFFNCTAFGKQAEFLEKYFHKGMKADCVGEIHNDNYTNKNGEKVYSVQVNISEVEFGESKGNGSSNAGDGDEFVEPPMTPDGQPQLNF